MSIFWKNILFLFCSFCTLQMQADDLDFFSRIYLSNKKYAKNIEIKVYLVTKAQVVKLFSGENDEIIQKTDQELRGGNVYLLVRCKNVGDYRSFGILNCTIPNRGSPISVEIMMMPGNMKFFHDSILFIGGGLISNDEKMPVIRCEWKGLYTI